ncbi:hypothetical protein G3545_24670 [Starkeya sp. ORNL1]|uniref:hypothetical protein n=1 Tax=Starkeya sp. ORNL1 TaxID=2709380 RepID=UPI0014633CDE|nr:hypothetical protein [Starkeya sp. ORNL1]QJP16547.1 hypothetical protein G3545_24670 [Starkeya sp. ORNL1]
MATTPRRTHVLPFLAGLVVLALLWSLTVQLRRDQFDATVGAQNLEATYHALLTVTALGESPPSHHWLLPTVSLGRPGDKGIPWGGTIPTATGDYVYTSFQPAGFLAPYLTFKLLGIAPSVENLALFSASVGLVSSLLLFALLYRLLVYAGRDPWLAATAAAAGCIIGLFSREALQSFGVIYWVHELYQPVLIVSLYACFRYLKAEPAGTCGAWFVILMAFVGPMVEWTAYVFNAGLVLLLWFAVDERTASRRLAIRIVVATMLAGLITVLHFSLAAGLLPTLMAFARRFFNRSAMASGQAGNPFAEYALSYGLFLVVIAALLLVLLLWHRTHRPIAKRERVLLLVFALAAIPLAENLLLLQHAMQFSFDRLKFIIPSAFIIAFGFAAARFWLRAAIALGLVVASMQGYRAYRHDIDARSAWIAADTANRALAGEVARVIDPGCAVLVSSLKVRGYANLLFHRGIHEQLSLTDLPGLIEVSRGCGGVFLDGEEAFVDLPRYTSATIIRADGTTTRIEAP